MRRLNGGKWRPPLGGVVAAILAVVMVLPLVGLFFFRLYENQLIRQTEAELIAQGAALGAIYADAVRKAGIPAERLGCGTSAVTGRHTPTPYPSPQGGGEFGGANAKSPSPLRGGVRGGGTSPSEFPCKAGVTTQSPDDRWQPVEPQLDLASDEVLGERPAAAAATADPDFIAIGQALSGILQDTQTTTLAGLRLTDPRGVVIAGQEEVGLTLAGVEEVRDALGGRYAARLRWRSTSQPAPALYSLSRGSRVRVFAAMPVDVGGRVAGVVYLSRTPNNIVKHLYSERGKVALAAIAVLGGTLLIGFVFLRAIGRPIHELIGRTRRIAAGDREAMVPLVHHGTREMAELSDAFLDMARKLQTRSDAIQTFATYVSHELKSPLTSIQGAAELLRDSGAEMDETERQRFSQNIVADAERLNRLVRRLLELARAENFSPGGEVATLGEGAALLPPVPGLAVRVGEGAEIASRMSAENLAIALSNLADNSARHGAATLSLSARRDGGRVAITAADDGGGISPGNRGKIFEPFFTTRRDSGGTGMGLGIVVALLKAHDGTIRLVDSGAGARFEIVLPAA